MSDAGLQVYASTGQVQIDSNYRNYHLVSKWSTPHYFDRSNNEMRVGSPDFITPARQNSIIAFGIDPWYEDVDLIPDSAITQKDYSGGIVYGGHFTQPYFYWNGRNAYDSSIIQSNFPSGQTRINGNGGTSYVSSVSTPRSGPVFNYSTMWHRDTMPRPEDGINLNVYEFDFVDFNASGAGFGMQVFNGGGEVVFDSNYKPMKVVAFYNAPAVYATAGKPVPFLWETWDYPFKEGHKYAIAPLGTPYRFFNQYKAGYYDGRDYVTSSGRSVYDRFVFQKTRIIHVIDVVPFDQKSSYQYLYTGMNTVPYLLLDVTGY